MLRVAGKVDVWVDLKRAKERDKRGCGLAGVDVHREDVIMGVVSSEGVSSYDVLRGCVERVC